jgi:hypothetical protein
MIDVALWSRARWMGVPLALAMGMFGVAQSAEASINLELRPAFQSVLLGNPASVQLFAVSDSAFNQPISALQVILNWDIAFVQLAGDNMAGSGFLTGSPRFGPDLHGLNASLTDGDAIWVGFAPLGNPVQATPAGTFVTTFNFSTHALTAGTPIDIVPTGGINNGETAVYGSIPALNVVGTLTGAIVQVVPGPGAFFALFGAAVIGGSRRHQQLI